MYGLHFRDELDEPVARELDAMLASLKAFLLLEHNEDGSHNFATSLTDETVRQIIDRYQTNGQWWKTGPWLLDDPTAAQPRKASLKPPKLSTGTYHNYTPDGIDTAVVLELEPDGGDVTLTGLKQVEGAVQVRLLMLRNRDSGSSLILKHEDTNSIAEYRFDLPESLDVTLDPGQNVWLYYDPDRNGGRWTAAITGQATGAVISNGPESSTAPGGGGAGDISSVEVTLSLADLVAGTPITLIAGVAGKIIVPISGSFHIEGVRGSVDPSINQALTFVYATLGSNAMSGFSLTLSAMGGGAAGSTFYGNGSMTQSSFTAGLASTNRAVGEAVMINFGSSGTAGNGSATMTIKVQYWLKDG